jgi:hypothetical protein
VHGLSEALANRVADSISHGVDYAFAQPIGDALEILVARKSAQRSPSRISLHVLASSCRPRLVSAACAGARGEQASIRTNEAREPLFS